jgi:hypothetical protein
MNEIQCTTTHHNRSVTAIPTSDDKANEASKQEQSEVASCSNSLSVDVGHVQRQRVRRQREDVVAEHQHLRDASR